MNINTVSDTKNNVICTSLWVKDMEFRSIGIHVTHKQCTDKYSLLMHCIKIKSRAKSLLNEQYVFVGGNISFLCVLSCISEEA